MKVAIINRSDERGGAAVVSARLMEALRAKGVDARMIVAEKLKSSPYISMAAPQWQLRRAFLSERLGIFLANGMDRSTLFRIDTAADGVALWRHPWVREADIICLNWINQGMLSLKGLGKLMELGKPIVWTMHDMWCFTGICHHAGSCTRYHGECGDCPLLGSRKRPADLSHAVWRRKEGLYRRPGAPTFVAVSSWLALLAHRSPLPAVSNARVIANAFPMPGIPAEELGAAKGKGEKTAIVMGAARLDDPVKGLGDLVEATRRLAARDSALAGRLELVTFGNVKDPSALEGFGIAHRHLGPVRESAIGDIYRGAGVVVSSSSYETLPGTLVEGQAYGCVPVAFDHGGQRDIVDHLSTGWLCVWSDNASERADRLAEGLAWAATRPADMAATLVKNVESRFAAPHIAEKYLKLFESLLSSHRR